MQVRSLASRCASLSLVHKSGLIVTLYLALLVPLQAQTPAEAETLPPSVSSTTTPIAIVPLDSRVPGSAATVTGALQVTGGRALIAANGTVVSGATTSEVTLPHRGMLRVCAFTSVKIAADSSVPTDESPGLMMAMDHGAIESSFATGRNANILLTPDFRILISGPGTTNIKVRLGQGGDTCVDNPGSSAPYVLVTSVFDGSLYRVQPGQRVMFQHGSLREVVDQEKEPCGCPPSSSETKGNDFPLAQSEGLAPAPKTGSVAKGDKTAQQTVPLVYNANEGNGNGSALAPSLQSASATPTEPGSASTQTPGQKKSNFFTRIGHFFRRVFGAE
jgi:hypothetical protein